MRTGNLRHRVTLQKKVKTQDGTGQEVYTWQTVKPAPIAGSVKALRASERVQAAKIDAQVTYTIIVRRSTQTEQLDHSWRVEHKGEYFAVHGRTRYGPWDEFFMLWCSEGLVDA